MTRRLVLFVLMLLSCFAGKNASGQLVVQSNTGASALINALIGGGLTVSNVVLNCDTGGYGTFSNGNTTNLGITGGILLTSGSAYNSLGPDIGGTSLSACPGNSTSSVDVDLAAVAQQNLYDMCLLEFDIVPTCNQLSISFVFGSEEYPNFVGSINDAFGFFITGPNPLGGNYNALNVALLPNGTPVSINNVNNGNTNTGPCQNCTYYVNNINGQTIQYNGLTTVITSTIALVPCQTYHFKIVIADGSDCALDSGVFIDNLTCSTSLQLTPTSTPASCNACDGTATVTATGGTPPYNYTWLPSGGNSATATNLCPGTYTVIVTDGTGCGPPDTTFVTITAASNVAVTSVVNNATCNGDCNGNVTVTPNSGTPPYTYNWLPSGGTGATASGLCAGQYTCDVIDGTGCSSQYTYTITEPPVLSVTMSNSVTLCANTSTTVSATPAGGTGPYTVTWNNALPNGTSNTVTPSQTTTYIATVTDANGCNTNDSVTVAASPAPTVAFTASAGTCAPTTVSFTNTSTGGNSYLWNFGDPSSGVNDTSSQFTPSHIYLYGGSYNVSLIVTNSIGCSDTLVLNNAVTVFGYPTAALDVANDHVSELDPSAVFTDQSTGGTNCVTYFGDGDSLVGCNLGTFSHTYSQPGTYTVTQITANGDGCADTVVIVVVVESESTIYVPNAFTPNADGHNPEFLAYGTNVNEFDMMIFDRWGMLLFESKDLFKGWDGKYKGSPVQEDVYVWKIVYTDSHNKRYRIIGHVSVVR